MNHSETKNLDNTFETISLQDTIRPRTPPLVDASENDHFLKKHLNDPNYDLKQLPSASDSFELQPRKSYNVALSLEDSDGQSTLRNPPSEPDPVDFDDESPYPEVRAAVSSVDEPLMPVNTFRMWLLAIVFSIVVSGLNQVFSMRYPSIYITGIVVQLLSLPLGKSLEYLLPTTQFTSYGFNWSFNPGPFNIKEHVCITVAANVAAGGPYAIHVIATQRIFYQQQLSFTYEILLALGTQILGFSLAGFLRRYVVWPSRMIWPGALVNSALFNTLHNNFGKRDRGHMTRERFFFIVMGCSFVWMWFPGYLFTALSLFNWACWIAPDNVAVNALFGTNTGLGLGILTFDWSMIAMIGSPLVTPWWSEMNTAVAFVILFWILTPIIYFTNSFNTAFLPISDYLAYDNTGLPYDATAIVTDGLFDVGKYQSYSPAFVSATLCVAYGASFAAFPAVFVHSFLWFRRDIVRRFRTSLADQRDVHSRLMTAYKEVPSWWYYLMGTVSFVFVVFAIEIMPGSGKLPVTSAAIAFLLAAVLSLPIAMLQAITNQQVTLQVMHELIAGYLLPGAPVANVIFKTIAFIGTNQAVGFAGDLKLGHYMHIPPRTMFMVQVIAAVLSCFSVVITQDWMLINIEDICSPEQKNGFICPGINTFATSSLIWGGIGPARLFSPGTFYNPLTWFFALGALLPIPFYFLARRFPLSAFRYVNIPVFFAGIGAIPPASGINYASWAIVGFVFNYYIRRYHFRWWMRYNYILSAGLDAGVAVGAVAIFAVLYATGGFQVEWWGNRVWMETADARGVPLRVVGEGEIFGPTTWS